jgi:hypothetical protein
MFPGICNHVQSGLCVNHICPCSHKVSLARHKSQSCMWNSCSYLKCSDKSSFLEGTVNRQGQNHNWNVIAIQREFKRQFESSIYVEILVLHWCFNWCLLWHFCPALTDQMAQQNFTGANIWKYNKHAAQVMPRQRCQSLCPHEIYQAKTASAER